ncbi:hypothetical protein M011DRAFT_463776 [Sporormia fimetaria CBS 119925]|uniref:Mid2 domain-containing protein n=1 Tax=Sporormia fimetaria CBS 119925 TaxID=1340428 RepID=A0A6A6VQZ4_9PLEO|nr:hypothetical protein M011DRAFT_463776 [Sporormia fimetaria CBS 119925]
MAPQSAITPPPNPHIARQTYDLSAAFDYSSMISSILASFSAQESLYASYSYDDSVYSSILASVYSRYYPSVTDAPGYTYPPATGTAGLFGSDPTAARISASSENDTGGGGGLSQGAKIGIGVGVPLAVGLLVGIGVFLWCAGKRKGKKSSTTIVAPMQQQQAYVPGFIAPPVPVPYGAPPVGPGYGAGADWKVAAEPHVVEMPTGYPARPGAVEMDAGTVQPGTGARR